jgi:hypothetical protein
MNAAILALEAAIGNQFDEAVVPVFAGGDEIGGEIEGVAHIGRRVVWFEAVEGAMQFGSFVGKSGDGVGLGVGGENHHLIARPQVIDDLMRGAAGRFQAGGRDIGRAHGGRRIDDQDDIAPAEAEGAHERTGQREDDQCGQNQL